MTSDIVVIGAGLAGLAAATELVANGREVTILEARSRPGGRVHTLREPFDDGLYAEAGAARIPDTHHIVRRYVEAEGLRFEPFRPAPPALFIDSHLVAFDDDDAIAQALHFDERDRQQPPRAVVAALTALASRVVGACAGPGWPDATAAPYDHVSLEGLVRQLGASDRVEQWFELGGGIIGPQSSALLWLRELALNHATSLSRIAGGNDRLPQAMARRLGTRVRYGVAVRRIEAAATSVRLSVDGASAHDTIECRRLICTAPFSVLRHMVIDPPFSAGKMRAIAELSYTPVTRAYAQTKRRTWLGRPSGGFVMSDHPMDIFDATWGQPGERGILMTYTRDALATRLAGLSAEAQTTFAVDALERVFPGVRANVERTTTVSWVTDEWAQGACADPLPGQLTTLWPHTSRSEGRVHFAGEHTSPWSGWMEGALESGERAAREVLLAGPA